MWTHFHQIQLLLLRHDHRHYFTVFQKNIEKNGFLYKGSYEGWYCTSDEAFVADEDITEAADSNGKVIKVTIAKKLTFH